MKKSRIITGAGALVAILVSPFVGVGSASANAPTPPASPTVVTVVTAMTPGGFNAQVAEANGFQIVTAADGTQSSIPVTASAKAMVAAANGTTGITPFVKDTRYGACGSSWISVTTQALEYKKIGTGFTVTLPVTTRWWGTTLLGPSGAYGVSFNGGASAGTWSSSAVVPFSSGGIGYINTGSYVIKSDGAICWTAGPQVSF